MLAGPHPRSLSRGDFAPRSGRRRFSMLAGPHISHSAWGPHPKRSRSRYALSAAQGCRSLSRGDFAPRSGRRRCS